MMTELSSVLFLAVAQAVQILSMMESDISSREAEVKTLREDVSRLRFQALAREDEHGAEVCDLSDQLEEARREAVSCLPLLKANTSPLRKLFSAHELTLLTQGKLNEQLRVVLEENVALQKQLIKLERQYLKSMMKSSPVTQIRGGCDFFHQRCI